MIDVRVDRIKGSETTKIERYNWAKLADEPGELAWIPKYEIYIDYDYQRDPVDRKVNSIAGEWSWIACGAIIVAKRGENHYVVDGQHRLLAARKRSDITNLPCIIYRAEGKKEEAGAFITSNTQRRLPASVEIFDAKIVAKDEPSLIVKSIFSELGIEAKKHPCAVNHTKSVKWATDKAAVDPARLHDVFEVAVWISDDPHGIRQAVIAGLWLFSESIDIKESRFMAKLKSIGSSALFAASRRAMAFTGKGGPKVWATGMLQHINKGRRHKYVIDSVPEL